jgi:membrane-bound lytic murein transglycosylase A
MARGRLLLLFVVLCVAAILAWWATHKTIPFLAPQMRLAPVTWSDLPGWKTSDPRAALSAFARSCDALKKKPDGASMGGAGYAGIAADWRGMCRDVPSGSVSVARARSFFEEKTLPVAVSSGGDATGTFTGYYEPQIRGSRMRHGVYQTPVYATPENLVTVDAGQFADDLAGRHFTGCVDGHKLIKCPARSDIDATGSPKSKILFYADDPISVFFLQIQGSGRVRFDDGTAARVNYDSQNGQSYTAVGKTLIQMGVPRDGMSMQVIRKWLKDHPQEAQRVMETDKSFVFFREELVGDASEGAEGSEGVPLTPGASLAVDMKLHPLGVPMFVAATRPDANPARGDHPFDTLMVAQDSGGAIKGAVRGDVFWGFGTDEESIAGRMKSAGRLYVSLPKALAAKLGAGMDYAAP